MTSGTLQALSRKPGFWMLVAILLTALCYLPALQGGFLFDDYPNIVDNKALHVDSLALTDWIAAANASTSKQLRRPLAMLTFAVNEYFTGNDPMPMKIVNLCIHLLNGVLLYRMIGALGRARRALVGLSPENRISIAPDWLASGIAALWMILPINFTGAIYIVQRMESLAQLCVLTGLCQYFEARTAQLEGRNGMLRAYLALILGSAVGLMCKETAILLPLYAALAEFSVLHLRCKRKADKAGLLLMFALLVLLPGIAAIVTILPATLNPDAYASRTFTLAQRLLTEPRLLFDYLHWTLMPNISDLGFYHDDIPVSIDWLKPPQTFLAIAGVISLIAIAASGWLRKYAPLFSLGTLWFFAAHLLTATVIPLELVYEHRNYFSSIGALVAVAGIADVCHLRSNPWMYWAPVGLFFIYGGLCAERAFDWSSPLSFSKSEAEHHPDSARAQYEFGRTLIIASEYDPNSPYIDQAYTVLEKNAAIPNASALGDSALILLANQIHQPVRPEWWDQMDLKLCDQPVSEENISALTILESCNRDNNCATDVSHLARGFACAMSHQPIKPNLTTAYRDFLDDNRPQYNVIEQEMRSVIANHPQASGLRFALVDLALSTNDMITARKEIKALQEMQLDENERKRLIFISEKIAP